MKLIDLTGKRFVRWVVIERAPDRGRATYWRCRCDCGTERAVCGSSLTGGKSLSCGCYNREQQRELHLIHGHSRNRGEGTFFSTTYQRWQKIRRRCTLPSDPAFRNYGARGIRVCDRWLESFENFLADMGEAPDGMEIDRINNDGNYEPGNCRWATRVEQMRNMRRNHYVDLADGRGPLALVEQCEHLNRNYKTVRTRISQGWTDVEALTVPTSGPYVPHVSIKARQSGMIGN